MRYLGIVGASGSGKTELMKSLIRDYPSLFFKVDQVTTREIRDGETGDAYVWLIRKADYRKIEHLLFAKTEVHGELYGSIPDSREGLVGVVILNEKGLMDMLATPGIERDNYYILGLNRPSDELPRRVGRDEGYVAREKEVLKFADYVLEVSRGKWAKTEEVMNLAREYFEI